MSVHASRWLPVPLAEGLTQARREWGRNARLRWGVRLIGATLVLWLCLLAQDQAAAWRTESEDLSAQAARLRRLQSESSWPQRADEAHALLQSIQAQLWTAASQGQAEAILQDRLRELCDKAGVPIRELAVFSGEAGTLKGVRPLRVRLVVDMTNRLAFMGLLSEIGQSPQVMIIDALRLRPQGAPPQGELEIRVLYREPSKTP